MWVVGQPLFILELLFSKGVMMELYQLEYFREIVASGSLHAAAKRLHVAQPSLSRCVKSLEEELGTPLFDRVGRNIVLNESGRIVLHRAEVTLDAARSIKRDVDAYARKKEQTLNLYMPFPIGDDERVFYLFRKKYPHIRVRIGITGFDSVIDETPDLTFFASPTIHNESNYLKVGEERIVLAVPAWSDLAQCESIKLSDMADEEFIFSMPGRHRDMCMDMFSQIEAKPHIVMENQWYIQIMRSVAQGYGYALVPSITWFSSAETNVVGVPISDVFRTRYLYLKWREGSVLSEPARLLRDHLVEHFKEVCA